jgi:hypothetical protein
MMQFLRSPLARQFSTRSRAVVQTKSIVFPASIARRFQKAVTAGMYWRKGNSSTGGLAPGSIAAVHCAM